MTRICRIEGLGRALAVASACCLAGCQPLQTNSAPDRSPLSWPSDDGKMTAARQADMQIAMGRVQERQGDLVQAMALYHEAVKRDGRRGDAYARMAILHDKQGEFRESAELYRQALKVSPGNPDIFCDMGYSLYLQRRWAEAEMNLRQAIAINAKHARAHNNLALLLACNNRLVDALDEFRRAGNNSASAHANLAFVLTTERRWDEARQHYELALAADPSSKELRDRLAQLNNLVVKVETRRDGAERKTDTQLVMTSGNTATAAADALRSRGSAGGGFAPAVSRRLPSPQVPPTSPVDHHQDGGTAVAMLVNQAPAEEPYGALRPSSKTVALPQTPSAIEPTGRDSAPRPRTPIPAPKAFTMRTPVRHDLQQPAPSRPVVPPPRTDLPKPDRTEPHESPETRPVTTRVMIDVPNAE